MRNTLQQIIYECHRPYIITTAFLFCDQRYPDYCKAKNFDYFVTSLLLKNNVIDCRDHKDVNFNKHNNNNSLRCYTFTFINNHYIDSP